MWNHGHIDINYGLFDSNAWRKKLGVRRIEMKHTNKKKCNAKMQPLAFKKLTASNLAFHHESNPF